MTGAPFAMTGSSICIRGLWSGGLAAALLPGDVGGTDLGQHLARQSLCFRSAQLSRHSVGEIYYWQFESHGFENQLSRLACYRNKARAQCFVSPHDLSEGSLQRRQIQWTT